MQPGPVLKLIREDKDAKNMFQELPHKLFCATVNSRVKTLLQFPTLLKHMLCVEFRFSSSELQRRNKKKTKKHTTPTPNVVFSKAAFTPRGGEMWIWAFFLIFLSDSSKPHSLKWLDFNFVPFVSQCLFPCKLGINSEISEPGNLSFRKLKEK